MTSDPEDYGSDAAEELNNAGLQAWNEGRGRDALLCFEKASKAARAHGYAAGEIASIDGNLAEAARGLGDFALAEDALLSILDFRRSAFVGRPAELLTTLLDLADVGLRAGNDEGALSAAREARTIVGTAEADGKPLCAFPVADHAKKLIALALIAAERQPEAAAAVDEVKSAGSSQWMDFLEELIDLHTERGDTARAADAALLLVAAVRTDTQNSHEPLLRAVNRAGSRCYDDKRYTAAIDYFNEACRLAASAELPAETRIIFLANLAKAHIELDRLVDAATVLDEADRFMSAAGINWHPNAVGVLLARTQWLRRQRKLIEARETVEQAIHICESHFGDNCPQLATPLNFLGGLYLDQDKRREAERTYERITQLDGLTPLRRATALHNIGNLRLASKDLAGARAATTEAITIKTRYGRDHIRLAASLANLGAIERDCGSTEEAIALLGTALQLEVDTYGPASPQSAETLSNLAGALAAAGRLQEATSHLETVLGAQLARMRDEITLNNDGERIRLLRDMRHELDAYIGISSANISRGAATAAAVYREVARRKGLATEALSHEIKRLRNSIAGPTSFSSLLGDAGIQVSAGSVFVDFVAYGGSSLTLSPNPKVPLPNTMRYGAFVLFSSGEILFRDLGAAEHIEPAVVNAMRLVRSDRELARTREATHSLRQLVWDPLRLDDPTIEHVIVSPDGVLNDVSFSALAEGEHSWLGDRLFFSYVNSARDLVDDEEDPTGSGSDMVLADPAYPLTPTGGVRWRRLPSARDEGEQVAELLGCIPHVFREATAEKLLQATSPRVLHIAAHGFYWRQEDQSPQLSPWLRNMWGSADPLHRAGIALSPSTKCDSEAIQNGIVTAKDLLGVDLTGTRLAVLSACDTALGQPEPLDGAHGLRRALRAAGVDTVVASLWKVVDSTAPILMSRFYRQLASEPPHRALTLAARQLSRERTTRHPAHWAAFIAFGRLGAPISPERRAHS